MHKKVSPVKYQVNKYEEFILFITIVINSTLQEEKREHVYA